MKDIGAGFITFTIEAVGKTDPAEYSMQLYPTTVTLGDADVIDPGAASVPLVAPPTNTPPPPPTTPQPQPGTTTTIIQDKPSSPNVTVPPPAQAPTQLKP